VKKTLLLLATVLVVLATATAPSIAANINPICPPATCDIQ
jgi:hypothetical protein